MQPAQPPGGGAGTTVQNTIVWALVLGVVSLFGLVFPPLFGCGAGAVLLGRSARRRIAASGGVQKGGSAAWIAVALGVLGCLLSLVIPGFVAYVWIYAIFHGGQLPTGPAITPAPFPRPSG